MYLFGYSSSLFVHHSRRCEMHCKHCAATKFNTAIQGTTHDALFQVHPPDPSFWAPISSPMSSPLTALPSAFWNDHISLCLFLLAASGDDEDNIASSRNLEQQSASCTSDAVAAVGVWSVVDLLRFQNCEKKRKNALSCVLYKSVESLNGCLCNVMHGIAGNFWFILINIKGYGDILQYTFITV